MGKQLLFKDKARKEIKKGIDLVADAVKVTMGPKGRNVALGRGYGVPYITKDGVTVSKEIVCEDYLDQSTCEANNCYWYNELCHSILPSCDILNNQIDCEAYGCYWWNNACHATPPDCSPEGATQCFGDDLYECQSGQWVLIEENSAECITPPPPEIPWALIGASIIAIGVAGYIFIISKR